MVRKLLMTAIGAAGLLAGTAAFAQSYTFDFHSPNNSQGFQSSREFTSTTGGIKVTATAWYSSSPTGAVSQSLTTASDTNSGVGWWTAGLGASNPNEVERNNDHTIDNVGSYDFILLTFDRPVQLLSGFITPFDVTPNVAGNDSDAWVSFTYNPTLKAITDSAVFANLQLHGTEVNGRANTTSEYRLNFNPGMNTGNQWIIGASHNASSRDDGFKLGTIDVQLPVPEPASWALMMAGVGITGGALRRRGRKAATPATA